MTNLYRSPTFSQLGTTDLNNPWVFLREDACAFAAWERMTEGGISITLLPKRAEPMAPWGIDRFREPTPPGGLRLVSWDDGIR